MEIAVNEGAERLVAALIVLIRERGGSVGLNMRAVARQAECAHTNVYNHFRDYEGLLWAGMARALDEYVRFVEARLGELDGAPTWEALLGAQIAFVLDEGGLARFIYLENRFTTPMPQVVADRLRGMFSAALTLPGAPDAETAAMVDTWLLGEFTRSLQGRVADASPDAARTRITDALAGLLARLR